MNYIKVDVDKDYLFYLIAEIYDLVEDGNTNEALEMLADMQVYFKADNESLFAPDPESTWKTEIIINGDLSYTARMTDKKIQELLNKAEKLERNTVNDPIQ